MATEVQGKTVIVTGAAGGLGKVIAEAFLKAGANVVVGDVNEERLAATASEWSASYADKYLTQKTDITDEASVQGLVDAGVAKFGRLDALVNNAGVMDDFSPVGACSQSNWDRVLGVNLHGTFLASKAAVTQFEKQSPVRGVIVNIGSNASVYGFQSGVAYTVSKAGVLAMTKNTAGFYGPKGINCVALLLGGMPTTNIVDAFRLGLHQEGFAATQAANVSLQPGKNDTDLNAVAKQVVFLTDSDIASNANGSAIMFNHNWPVA
ncbi:NAD(P)-binding protein [Thozetella sp. PMI_491]|nr:NAD(P)-binding protein [Thozetella sp. PMI_491]